MSTQVFYEGIAELEREFGMLITGKTLMYSFKGNMLILTNPNGVELMTLKKM